MEFPLRDRAAIAGIGATDFSRRSGESVLTLATRAARAAIVDAGVPANTVDGVVRTDVDEFPATDLANALGLPELNFFAEVEAGGSAPSAMIGVAASAVYAGLAKSVLVLRALNGRSGKRYGIPLGEGGAVGGGGSYEEFFAPYGLVAPGHLYALIASRHQIEYGTTKEDLGTVALACRRRANGNPRAQMSSRQLTMDDYLSAPMLSSPLGLFDYCLETDGACAVLVTSTEQARDCRTSPVLVRAVAQAGGAGGVMNRTLFRDTITTTPSAAAAQLLYRRAGVAPSEVDVAQIYDCFTISVIVQLEDYGFCRKGEGGAFASSGAIEPGGILPINTAGGNLSEGYLQGMNHVVEGVRALRGESTTALKSPEICLVTSGTPNPTSALLLRNE